MVLTLDEGMCMMKGALWRLPTLEDYTNDIENLEKISDMDTTAYGNDLKTIVYHPMEGTKAVAVVDNNFVLWSLDGPRPQVIFYCILDISCIFRIKIIYPICLFRYRQWAH